MQVVENWSLVVGRIERWTPPEGATGQGELVIHVERVEPVTGHRHLLADAVGTSLRVRVPGSAAVRLDASAGASISVQVRRGRQAGIVFANPGTLRI